MKAEPKVILLTHTPDAEKLVATAARLCYSADEIDKIMDGFTPEKIDKFIDLLVSLGHESPFEHVTFSFGISGVSRALSHQLVRHRIASYNQRSQRYVKEDEFDFIIPPSIEQDVDAMITYAEAMKNASNSYIELFDTLLENKCRRYLHDREPGLAHVHQSMSYEELTGYMRTNYKKKFGQFEKETAEDARYVLPNACETQLIVTMNVRALYNFFSHRCCNRAQWEIRNIAYLMLAICRQIAPKLFANAGAPCAHGVCPENSMQCDQLRGKVPTEEQVKELVKLHYNR